MLDLTPFTKKARELFGLEDHEVEAAEREFRHFLYLVGWNKREGNAEVVVPTKRADKLWHAALLFTRDYRRLCEQLFGSFLDHQPGLEEGTPELDRASVHTKRLHDTVMTKVPGFDPGYFSFILIPVAVAATPVKAAAAAKSKQDSSGGCGGHVAACGGGSSTGARSSVDSSDSSSGFGGFGGGDSGGGGASSCGGGGCGGCGG